MSTAKQDIIDTLTKIKLAGWDGYTIDNIIKDIETATDKAPKSLTSYCDYRIRTDFIDTQIDVEDADGELSQDYNLFNSLLNELYPRYLKELEQQKAKTEIITEKQKSQSASLIGRVPLYSLFSKVKTPHPKEVHPEQRPLLGNDEHSPRLISVGGGKG